MLSARFMIFLGTILLSFIPFHYFIYLGNFYCNCVWTRSVRWPVGVSAVRVHGGPVVPGHLYPYLAALMVNRTPVWPLYCRTNLSYNNDYTPAYFKLSKECREYTYSFFLYTRFKNINRYQWYNNFLSIFGTKIIHHTNFKFQSFTVIIIVIFTRAYILILANNIATVFRFQINIELILRNLISILLYYTATE